jgi:hypothetical protein
MHAILAHYYKGVREGLSYENNVEQTVAKFEEEAIDINGLIVEDIPIIIATFHEYTQHYLDRDKFEIVTVEEKLSKVLYEDDDTVILYEGTIDMTISEAGLIIPYDHKSESAKYQVSQLNNQFMGYCFLTESPRMIRNAIGFQKSKSSAEKFYRTMFCYSDNSIKWWRRMTSKKILEMLAHYKADDWNLSGNLYACDSLFRRGCEFKQVCSEEETEWQRMLEENYVEVPLYS